MKRLFIPEYNITIETAGGGGTITSGLKEQFLSGDKNPRLTRYDAGVVDALESFLLALACQGVDVSAPQFEDALTTTLEAIANND